MGRSAESDAERARRFTELVTTHADTVNRYLRNRHRAGDLLDAEDLLAEVFSIAWRRFDDVPADADVAWLIGVARNRLMNMRSKQSRRARLSAILSRRSTTSAAEEEVVAQMTLGAAIASLPDAEREAFTLSVWEGLSPHELGIALGTTKNAAAVRLSRAKSLLLGRLADDPVEIHGTVAKDTE